MGKWQNKKLWTGQISLRSPYIGPKCWRPSTNLENTWNLVREEVLACRRGNEQNKKLFSGENTSKKPVTRFVEPLQHHLRPPKIDWNCFGRHHWWRFDQYKKLWTGQISLRSPKLNQKCWIWSTEFESTWNLVREEFWCARGNLTLLRNFSVDEQALWSLGSESARLIRAQICVIRAYLHSNLALRGLVGLMRAHIIEIKVFGSTWLRFASLGAIGSPCQSSGPEYQSWGLIIPQDSNLAHCLIWVTRTEIRSATRIWFSYRGYGLSGLFRA